MAYAGEAHVDVVEAAAKEVGDDGCVGEIGNAQQKMSARRAEAAQLGEERPRLVEMLDDVAADDPVEALVEDRDDLPHVASIDGVDAFARHRRGRGIELDPDDTALLPFFERLAERRFAAPEFENGLCPAVDQIEQVMARLPAEGAPAMDVVGRR